MSTQKRVLEAVIRSDARRLAELKAEVARLEAQLTVNTQRLIVVESELLDAQERVS